LFYPENKEALLAKIRSFGFESGTGAAAAIVAPHGAWDISGAVAASAFMAASGRARKKDAKAVSKVALLGIVHECREEGLYLSDSDFFETPLGNLPVEKELCEELASCGTLFEINDMPHLQEHSIEVLLPLVKHCFPKASIAPILMGSPRPSLISCLAKAMRIVFEPIMEETLLVISCNLSKNGSETQARLQAEECVRLVIENKTGEFISGLFNGRVSACGGALAASLLESGLVKDKQPRIVSGPLVKTMEENGQTVYYGALSFE
jgi:AmmeMemoRadiSam system protein B